MSEITTQSIVEEINRNTMESIELKWTIGNLKQELEQSELYQHIQELESSLKDLYDRDNSLRESAKNKMIEAWAKKFEALDGTTIQLNKKPWALVIEDDSIEALNDYRKEKVTVSIDKKQLKEDIKEWLIIEGVFIKEDYALVIKN